MQHQFRITYDGTALQSSEMDVRELAPALLAIGDLLDSATRVLNGDRVKAQTNVRASFQTGCFGIDFNIATDWALKIKDMFSGEPASTYANAIQILTFLGIVAGTGIKGLFSVLKWLRGRKIERVEVADKSARLFVEKEMLEIELSVLALLRDLSVRQAMDKVLAPLDKEGIDTFACGTDKEIVETISKAERAWYYVPDIEDELMLDDVRKMAFSIVSLAFKEDNKWRLFDGAATIHATITDIGFLNRVDQNIERFAKGDSLLCLVRVRQWQITSGIRTEYEVTEVLEHRQAARQIHLPYQ